MKEEIKILKNYTIHRRFLFVYKTMLSYFLKCRKKIENKNQRVAQTERGKPMLLWKWAVCDSRKSRFIKEEEVGGLLSINTPQSQIRLVGSILF